MLPSICPQLYELAGSTLLCPNPLTSNLEASIHTWEVIPPAIEKKSSPPDVSSICPQLYELAGSTLLSSMGANSSSIQPKSSTGAFLVPPNFRAPLWGLTEVFVCVWTDKSSSLPHPQSSEDFVLDICDDCWGLVFAVSDVWTLNWLWKGKRFCVVKFLKMNNFRKCTKYETCAFCTGFIFCTFAAFCTGFIFCTFLCILHRFHILYISCFWHRFHIL